MKRKPKKHNKDETFGLVSLQLLKKGFWVSINKSEIKNNEYHMQCSNFETTKRVKILICKDENFSGKWMLDEKNDDYNFPDLFYVFVGYNKSFKKPKLFVVPSQIVSEYIKKDGKVWISGYTKKGQLHKNIQKRGFDIESKDEKKYLNKWNLLGLD
ncbi:MAG: hypothetical protein UT84_C0012G0001 [Candidatus Curtissbacteria bacterium GW2011_GWA1_40_16]|uniref:Uncharacterized protein n=1 Tax=Candidatus Curtissbacteria bacterium GW2011_GWA1_40_16 TaxID=1618405 RepID=A0A0G0RD21_9BACT|nr:MAG: hypothetical protein UT84_C0012G0001 [Candidatus Curtissbacteria bacterium GW2011_GWA1_40_16]